MHLPPDKRAHAWAGAMIAATGSIGLGTPLACAWGRLTWPITLAVTLLIVICLAVGKELWDARHPPHRAEVADAMATIAGGLAVLIPLALAAAAIP